MDPLADGLAVYVRCCCSRQEHDANTLPQLAIIPPREYQLPSAYILHAAVWLSHFRNATYVLHIKGLRTSPMGGTVRAAGHGP